jgi:DNA polymerase/3'-5' exonuclease PolX
MSDHPRIPRADALALAEQLVTHLSPSCERIEIAGSVRRHTETVGDIEIVAIAQTARAVDLFGQPIGAPRSLLDDVLTDLAARWLINPGSKNGPAFKQFTYEGVTVDLFLVTPETWAVQYMIRTGCAVFSHWMVTAESAGGALPFGYKIAEGRLWHLGQAVATPEEPDLFAAIGLPYIPPADRSAIDWFQRSRAAVIRRYQDHQP